MKRKGGAKEGNKFNINIFFQVTFAKDKQITASKSSLLFIYIGIFSTLSRIVIGKIIERKWLTPIQGVQFSSFLIGISLILFSQAKIYSHFITFAVFYGFANGGYTVSQAVFYMTCFSDLKMASVGWTTAYVFSAVALFIGPPFAGKHIVFIVGSGGGGSFCGKGG